MKKTSLIFVYSSIALLLAACGTSSSSVAPSSSSSSSSEESSSPTSSSASESSSSQSSPSSLSESSSTSEASSSSEISSSESSSSSAFSSSSEEEKKGYVKVAPKYVSTDYFPSYTPNEGDVSILVVPFSLKGASDARRYYFSNWTTGMQDKVHECYFGTDGGSINGLKEDWFTFKEYYETASFNKVSIQGMVAPVYECGSDISIQTILNGEEGMEYLFDLLDKMVFDLQIKFPEADWSAYDRNQDGYFDAVHFISDYQGASWAQNLWPHMTNTARPAVEKLRPNVYSLSSIEHFSNAVTAIHEQGHMFGLNDYYDYSYTNYNFVGGADMQDSNMFDWNAYSKLTVGWATPTVITGEKEEVTLTIPASGIAGDCLLIPADYSSWNGTAYDEYFLFELFSPINYNNYVSFKAWNLYHQDLNYGVKAYYVNSPACGIFDEEVEPIYTPEETKPAYFGTCANNSGNYADYDIGLEEFKTSPLLTVISKSTKGKFALRNASDLVQDDLFQTGDIFGFRTANTSLKKGGGNSLGMFNGDKWRYEVHFDKVTLEEMTLTIKKMG